MIKLLLLIHSLIILNMTEIKKKQFLLYVFLVYSNVFLVYSIFKVV